MINTIVIMGRLTTGIEVKKTNSGVSYTSFSVAVERNYKNGDEKQTDFIPCSAWRGTADFIGKYFNKGDMIALTGSLNSDKFTDKDGNNRTSYKVLVESVSFCGSKTSGNDSNNGNGSQNGNMDTVEDDDFPFG